MADSRITIQYWLGVSIQATIPPDLVYVRAMPLFARNHVAAEHAFTLEHYTCDRSEINTLTLAERIRHDDRIHAFNESSCVRVATGDWAGFIDVPRQHIWLLTAQETAEEGYVGILGYYLRRVVPPERGIFIHCAGVHLAGQTLLFLAPSGTGKTTLSRRAYEKGFHVLSDETVFVSWDTPEFVAYATPFGRLSSGPLSTPISKVFFLRQGDAFAVRPMSAPRAVIAAWKDSYYRDFWEEIPGEFVLHFRNDAIGPEQKRLIISRWYELFSSVPCYEMQFPRDFDDWDSLLALP